MALDAKQIFLISGQMLAGKEGDVEKWAPVIEQQIVAAESGQAAYALLTEKMPNFRPLGFATLDDYEQAVSKIKATLKGVETGWGLMLAPGLSA